MVSAEEKLIRFPAAALKQGRDHLVPIAPALQEVLDACVVDARSDLVFPSTKTGGRISGWKQLRAPLAKRAGVDFTLHDLRRTFRTGLSRLGVTDDIAELALGHARGKLEAIYNRDEAVAQLRKAFDLWADHVSGAAHSLPSNSGTSSQPSQKPVFVYPSKDDDYFIDDPLPPRLRGRPSGLPQMIQDYTDIELAKRSKKKVSEIQDQLAASRNVTREGIRRSARKGKKFLRKFDDIS